MRRLAIISALTPLVFCGGWRARAQTAAPKADATASGEVLSASAQRPGSLPDAPGEMFVEATPVFSDPMAPCNRRVAGTAMAGSATGAAVCPDPFHRFLDSTRAVPLTPEQKAHLAVHNVLDMGNLVTIVGTAAFTVGVDSHTAYGPGWKGFGRNTGYSLLQDTTGEFFGTFLIPSLAGEDPHYHRMPTAGVPRRLLHAISRTVIAQSDEGRPMPNYSTLLTYPICAEISNLYVPGVAGNGLSTMKRVLTGLATDPVDNVITEFLPDFAKHIHVRVIFVQRVLNQVAAEPAGQP